MTNKAPGLNAAETTKHFRVFYNNTSSIQANVKNLAQRMEAAFVKFDTGLGLNLRSPMEADRFKGLHSTPLLNIDKTRFSVYILPTKVHPTTGIPQPGGLTYLTCPYITLSDAYLTSTNLTPEHEVFHLFLWGYTNLRAFWFDEGLATLSQLLFSTPTTPAITNLSVIPSQPLIFASKSYPNSANLWFTAHNSFDYLHNDPNFIRYFLESLDAMDHRDDLGPIKPATIFFAGKYLKNETTAFYKGNPPTTAPTPMHVSNAINNKIYCTAIAVLNAGKAVSSGC